MDTSDYEYQPGVRDKVKQIESRLSSLGRKESEEGCKSEADEKSKERKSEDVVIKSEPSPVPNPPVPLPRKSAPSPPQLQKPTRQASVPIQIDDDLVGRMRASLQDQSRASSVSSTRRSSEDDGIADMASVESDAFDDSTMPLPKIKENAFYLKDRRRSKGEEEDVPEASEAPPLSPSPRRGSLISQKLLRTRNDSTNSAENYLVQQISTERKGSQAEVKIDFLQSPVGSPVVVKSTTMSNSTASILLLGLPQSGKSSTINSLVQVHVASKTEDAFNSSPEIVEYTAKIKILDSSNLFNLKIIETPGYTNDPTISSDAQLMSTLTSYLESKSGLRGKPPTVTLVVLKFTDKRLWNPEDEHPDMVNFLKVINNFQSLLNDGKYANFVFVLTNFMNNEGSFRDLRKPQGKIVELINLIQKYTSLPHPIMVTCAENEVKIEGRRNSIANHSFTVSLPNGETYPYNLIERIKILLTKKGRDSVGETVLRTAFGIEYPYSIKECRVTQRLPLFPVGHQSIPAMQKRLLHAYLDIEKTEIFTLLEIGWENIPKEIRSKYPDSLYTVQQIFQTKKIRNFEDVPEEPFKVLNLVRQMPSNLAVKDLLCETLQLKVPACYAALYIGQGFDICKDAPVNVSPFQFTSGLKTSPVGLIPNEFLCRIRDDREITFKFFNSTEEYVAERLKDLNLRYAISPNSLANYSNQHRLGYNLIKKNQEPTKYTVATALIEYRQFQLTLPQSEISFKPQFWDVVKDLPDLDIKNSSNVSAWKDFFNYWGTHVVKSAFGGGTVEITFRGEILSKIFNSMKKDVIQASEEYDTTRVFQWVTGDGLDFVSSYGNDRKSEFIKGFDVEAVFRGGDIKFQGVDLTKLEKERVAEMREEWKESLVGNPIMLETSLELVPLSHFVRGMDEGIATKIDVALHYFYSDFLVSNGKQSNCTIL